METKLKTNLTKVLDEIKNKYDVEYEIDNGFTIRKDGKLITSGSLSYKKDKVEIYDELNGKYKSVKSYEKLLEIIDWNVSKKFNEIERNEKINELGAKLQKIEYIVENYNIYKENRGFVLIPKDYSKVFSISVKVWLDTGVKIYINFNKDIEFKDIEKITDATEEFKKITNLI